jgi:hypothetical protein
MEKGSAQGNTIRILFLWARQPGITYILGEETRICHSANTSLVQFKDSSNVEVSRI